MANRITRRGARDLTTLIERVANTIQHNPHVLGIDPRIAHDFALRCDMISDAVELTAAINFPLSVGPKTESDEPYMRTFDQEEFSQLSGRVEKGDLAGSDSKTASNLDMVNLFA